MQRETDSNQQSNQPPISPDLYFAFLNSDIRSFLSSVKGWTEVISRDSRLNSIKFTQDPPITLADAMLMLQERCDELRKRLDHASLYFETYQSKVRQLPDHIDPVLLQVSATDMAYHLFIRDVAYQAERSEDEVREEVSIGDFLIRIHDLHSRYLMGEFSIERLAELLGINPFHIGFLLATLGLSVHN